MMETGKGSYAHATKSKPKTMSMNAEAKEEAIPLNPKAVSNDGLYGCAGLPFAFARDENGVVGDEKANAKEKSNRGDKSKEGVVVFDQFKFEMEGTVEAEVCLCLGLVFLLCGLDALFLFHF